MPRCPYYPVCTFEGETEAQVDDHVIYMDSFGLHETLTEEEE